MHFLNYPSIKRLVILIVVVHFISCNTSSKNKVSSSDTLYIMHAGSLSNPIKELVDSFKHKYPNILVYTEACGSKQCIQNIIHLHRRCHIFFSSDKALIDSFLVPKYCKQSYNFVSNAMVVAYHNQSKYCNEINTNNWYQIFTRPDVILGYSNPETDPCGERFFSILKLAEEYYHQLLLNKIINTNKKTVVRPKEIDLIALLELNQIDYTIIYKSLAIQHHLNYINLPDSLNLSSVNLENWYSKFNVQYIKHNKVITNPIKAIRYGYAILQDSPSSKKFIEFLSTPSAKKILIKHGHTIIY